MEIAKSGVEDVALAASCLAEAFADDLLMAYFFPGEHTLRHDLVREFFTIMMDEHLTLGMPVLLLKEEDRVLGVAMGDDTRRPDWLPSYVKRWSEFEAKHEGLAERFARTDAIGTKHRPAAPHYYLGVIGVGVTARGKGMGRALVDAYSRLSDADPQSTGIFLETAMPQNLDFYRRLGFEPCGEGRLDHATSLWCLFRPTVSAHSTALRD